MVAGLAFVLGTLLAGVAAGTALYWGWRYVEWRRDDPCWRPRQWWRVP